MNPQDRDLAAYLDWHIASGADAILRDAPVDRFAESARETPPSPPQRAQNDGPRPPAAPVPAQPPLIPAAPDDDDAVRSAVETAAACETLEALKAALSGFDACGLKKTAKQIVFSDGNPQGRVMLIGEAPGRDEDIQGKPFVGRSGQLLDRMLAAIGLDRTTVYIANIVPWRPPGNRTPTPVEMQICLPFLTRQIELAAPEIIVALGGASAKTLFETSDGILKTRGRWRNLSIGAHQARAIATLHPAYLLRSPIQKRLAWRDMLALRTALEIDARPDGDTR